MRPDALLLLRVLWGTLPLTVGPALDDALTGVSTPVTAVLAVGLWLGWAAVLLGLLVPREASLTAVRLGVPVLLVAVVWAVARDGVVAVDLLAAAVAALTAVVAVWPTVGDRLVDGSSYGPERRLPLRVPPSAAVAAAPLAVAAALAGVAAGPLLLAAEQWVLGALLTVIGLPLALAAARSVHALARRFLVLVPGGVVVHDPLTLTDPVLLPKGALVAVGPAPVDTDAEDLTLGAGGLIVELRLREPSELVRRHPGRHADAEVVATAAVLVAPTRPGAFLAEAQERGLPIG